MGHKGHYGQYTGNAKWSKNHADTKVTKSNYKATERDDAAHIDYLKRDINYDNKHGHNNYSMTADEKHISKLAGDMKYDKKHHGSPTKMVSAFNKEKEYTIDGKPLPANLQGYDPKNLITDQSKAEDKRLRQEANKKSRKRSDFVPKNPDAAPKMQSDTPLEGNAHSGKMAKYQEAGMSKQEAYEKASQDLKK